MIVRLNSSTARTCAVTLLLVGWGLVPSVAVALEVDRGGTLLNQKCGAERSGCGWCGTYSCYTVTTCTDTKCTVVRVAPQSIRHRPPTHGTGPVPTLPSTHKHQRLSANPNRPAGRGR